MGFAEHLEHAAHASEHDELGGSHGSRPTEHTHHSKGLGKNIGITMAMLGALLALCSAMLGGARNELISSMVERTAVGAKAQAASTKYRTLMAQLQQLHALLPTNASEFEQAEKRIDRIESASTSSAALPAIQVSRLETEKILNTVTPAASDVLRFVKIVRDYNQERALAEKWHASYQDSIHAHEHAAEHFEWALLCAEFGIVVCSVALLLQSRRAWHLALLLGALGLGIGLWTVVSYRAAHHHTTAQIEDAKRAFVALNVDGTQEQDDAALLLDIERIERTERTAKPSP
jgi:uncharacterized protein HemX